MKKLFFYLLPLLAAGWLLPMGGCRKCKGISGKVLEYGTETPIKDATVTLSDCTGGIGDPLVCTDVASKVTGSDGRFHFGADGFSVAAKAAGYWNTGDDFEMVINECPKPVLYLYPNAWLQVTYKNESGAYRLTHSNNVELFLPLGGDSTITEFKRGNVENTFVFGVESIPNDTTRTTYDDLQSVYVKDAFGNQIPTSLENSWSPWFNVSIKGHETTKITIIY